LEHIKRDIEALERGDIPERYSRNIGTLGVEGQIKLLQSHVVIVGLGGLGGYILENCARLGVGKITGIDRDSFEENNLNRQILAASDTIGKTKTVEAARRVAMINPNLQFTGRATRFENLPRDLFNECDLVFDCLDRLDTRRELALRCTVSGKTLIHGAIAGWCGQAGIVPPGNKILEQISKNHTQGIEKDLGNLPFTAAFAASMMIAKAIPLLLKEKEPKVELQFFDLRHGDWETIGF
jgi:molybdopterin/thiamine biosynthesis adenylyltransferase